MRLIALVRPGAFLRLLQRKPPHRAMGFVPSLTAHDLNAFSFRRLHSEHKMGLISQRGSRCSFATFFGTPNFHFGWTETPNLASRSFWGFPGHLVFGGCTPAFCRLWRGCQTSSFCCFPAHIGFFWLTLSIDTPSDITHTLRIQENWSSSRMIDR